MSHPTKTRAETSQFRMMMNIQRGAAYPKYFGINKFVIGSRQLVNISFSSFFNEKKTIFTQFHFRLRSNYFINLGFL